MESIEGTSFSQRLSHKVCLQRISHNVFLWTSFSQRLSHDFHNVFLTASFYNVFLQRLFLQRLSDNVFLTPFSQRFPYILVLTKLSSQYLDIRVIFLYEPKSPNYHFSKTRQNYNFWYFSKIIRIRTASINVIESIENLKLFSWLNYIL